MGEGEGEGGSEGAGRRQGVRAKVREVPLVVDGRVLKLNVVMVAHFVNRLKAIELYTLYGELHGLLILSQ